jgi:hypothetical protein
VKHTGNHDRARLKRLVEEVKTAPDTPAIISILAQDPELLQTAFRILTVQAVDDPSLFQELDGICREMEVTLPLLKKRLTPAARALGLSGSETSSEEGFYRLLGVPRDASDTAIRKAYLSRARELHPDVNPHVDPQQFAALAEAYRVLSAPDLRQSYDTKRAQEDPDWAERSPAFMAAAQEKVQGRQQQRRRLFFQLAIFLLLLFAGISVAVYLFEEQALLESSYVTPSSKPTTTPCPPPALDAGPSTPAAPVQVANLGRDKNDWSGPIETHYYVPHIAGGLAQDTPTVSRDTQTAASVDRESRGPHPERSNPGFEDAEGTGRKHLTPAVSEDTRPAMVPHDPPNRSIQPERPADMRPMETPHKPVSGDQPTAPTVSATSLRAQQQPAPGRRPEASESPRKTAADGHDPLTEKTSREVVKMLAELEASDIRPSASEHPGTTGHSSSPRPWNAAGSDIPERTGSHTQRAAPTVSAARTPAPQGPSLDMDRTNMKTRATAEPANQDRTKEKTPQDAVQMLAAMAATDTRPPPSDPADATPGAVSARSTEPDTQAPAASMDRIEDFLRRYCRAYETLDYLRFMGFFAEDAVENDTAVRQLKATYRDNFERLDALAYRIDVENLRSDRGEIEVSGRYQLKWRFHDQNWQEREGPIVLSLVRANGSYQVKRLLYR